MIRKLAAAPVAQACRHRWQAVAAGLVAAGTIGAVATLGTPTSGAAAASSAVPAPLSATPKRVVMDPSTGDVQSVTQLPPQAYAALLATAVQQSGSSSTPSGPSADTR